MSADRAARLAAAVEAAGLDQLVVGDLVRPGDSGPDAIADLRWLTGFTGTSGLALLGPREQLFLTDFRYVERARREVASGFEHAAVERELIPELGARLRGRVGFDERATSVRSLRQLGEALPEGAELIAVGGVVADLRRRKDAAEQEAIAEAAQLADEVYRWTLERGLVGRSERDVAAAAETRIRELGGEPAFRPIVAAGEDGAQPHAEPGPRLIEPSELVVFDLGAKLDGYCSDCTRTFATGEPGEVAREVYELVRGAQAAALAAVGPERSGIELDAVAREIIESGSYGEGFGHGLGHGVGLEVHEPPRLGPRSKDVVAAGDVITVEPGVYLPGRFGVRIEDLVVVTEDGHRNLSGLPKELQIVG